MYDVYRVRRRQESRGRVILIPQKGPRQIIFRAAVVFVCSHKAYLVLSLVTIELWILVKRLPKEEIHVFENQEAV